MEENRVEFAKKMNKLKQAYHSSLKDWADELEKFQKKTPNWTITDTNALQHLVHKITGTGATYGYPELTDAARSLEYKLAYSNLEFKISSSANPNKNNFIVSDLTALIRMAQNIKNSGEISRMEDSTYSDEAYLLSGLGDEQTNNKTILIVDDQEIVRETLKANLKTAGFNILEAQDGADALFVMESKVPDLVILDRSMPNLDGLSVLKMMRKVDRLKDVPVIFLTATYSPETILEATKLGSVDYVAKPYDPTEFTMRCIRFFQTKKSFGSKK